VMLQSLLRGNSCRENEESGVEPGKDHYVAHEVDSKPAHAKTGVCGTQKRFRIYRLRHPPTGVSYDSVRGARGQIKNIHNGKRTLGEL
jgi:hypothetical protein